MNGTSSLVSALCVGMAFAAGAKERVFGPGTHYLTETKVFTSADSGTVWKAAPGAKPVISGARKVSGWRKAEGGLWCADVPWVTGRESGFRQLTVDGALRPRAKHPNKDYFCSLDFPRPAGETWSSWEYASLKPRFRVNPGEVDPKWDLTKGEVVFYHLWNDSHCPASSLTVENGTNWVNLANPVKRNPCGCPWRLENLKEIADEPGEWALDYAEKRVYYRPFAGEDPAKAEIAVPFVDTLVRIDGARDVRFEGLTFADSRYELARDERNDFQASSRVTAAAVLTNAENCVFERCTFRNLSGYALDFQAGAYGSKVTDCTLTSLGAGGVRLGMDVETFKNTTTNLGYAAYQMPDPRARVRGNEISDCEIGDYGRDFPSAVGVLLMHAEDTKVVHNDIHDGYYTGVSVGWTWGYHPSVARDNLIEHNHIWNIGKGLISDMGGIYLLGLAPGTKVRHNLIHDIDARFYGGWGIYPDEGSSGLLIENNVVYNTKFAAFHQHFGRNNTVRNNIFAGGKVDQLAVSRWEPHTRFLFYNNIVWWREGVLHSGSWHDDKPYSYLRIPLSFRTEPEWKLLKTMECDYNLYFNPTKALKDVAWGTQKCSWDDWRGKYLQDRHSAWGDPLFVDAERHDYRLRPDSPALKLGFRPFDIRSAGRRPKAACRPPSVGWRPYAGNPVLGDAKLGTCFDVNVVTDGPAPYTMYFSWRPQKAIALVRSADGFTWTQEPEICLRADPTIEWEETDINRSCTVFRDGVWHMWYTGQSRNYTRSVIGYATSKDGVRFTRVTRKPVMVPDQAHEKESVMNPYVRWDAARKVWRMWYAAGETYEPNVLCYAESADGLVWKKWGKNPMFAHGAPLAWDRARVGGCEVHPLPDGRWAMFYIGYSDLDTARIGCAVSPDGITGWKRLGSTPVVAPDLGTWNGSACYKPSVVRDERNGRWLLWYNGRNGRPEYVGMAVHEGLDLEAPADAPADTRALLSDYVRRFNAHDVEHYTNAVPNASAEDFMLRNCPRFACPDKDIERTYYFRWWTFRKHLRHDLGHWTVTEFLPKVGWSGAGNTIVCPAGHHLREGRWLRDPQYIEDDARFWLASPKAEHRWGYSSWLFTGTRLFAEVTGRDGLPAELLDDAVRYYGRWEKGFERDAWPNPGKAFMGGDGKGGFTSIDGCEGTEYSLGGWGYKPLFASAMWSEAKAIAAVAQETGRTALADEYERKAETVRRSILDRCWNPSVSFFTTAATNGTKGVVRELHGYAPWYFGMPTDGRRPDWAQLADPEGFAATCGLTFPERRAKGFTIDYKGHECKWNGPSWPFATSVALTAFMNDLHASDSAASLRPLFTDLLRQYADAQRRTRDKATEGDYDVVPWIDENLHPDKPEWLSRRIILDTPSMAKAFPRERGKDYNHSTFCDLVISGLVGFQPDGEAGFAVDPLFPADWDYLVLEDLRYRGHDVSVRWQRGRGLVVTVDGREAARRPDLGRVEVRLAPAVRAEKIRPASVEWEFPRTANCHEGLPFSDGVTGVLVWGGGDTVNVTVGRADLWDHRGGYPWLASQSYTNIAVLAARHDEKALRALFPNPAKPGEPRNPYMLPLGRVVVKVPGKTLKRGTLDTETGIGRLVFTDGASVEMAMPKAKRVFAMDFGDLPVEATCVPATDHEPFFKDELAPMGFKKAVKRKDGFDWELPADKPVSLDCVVRNGFLVLSTCRADAGRRASGFAAKTSFGQLRQDSVDQWRAFWEKGARVRVPDPVVQRLYDYGMYRFGAMTDPDGVPAGLQGAWLEDDRLVPWNGDYHFNINVQECYAPAYRGGHFENLMPLFRMILSWRPLLRSNAKTFVGIDDGYVLPHSVDDRGVCIGGFWSGTIDHGSTAWMASMMYRYVKYSGDVAFLKESAYDFMKGAMNVYLAMTEERDGRLSMPLCASPEWYWVGRDSSFQLAAAHRLARDLVDAAARLGVAPDARWLDLMRRLPPYNRGKDGGIDIYEGQPLAESHRHHSHLAGLYPFDTLDLSDKKTFADAKAAIDHWTLMGTGLWSGWCVPWAAILHAHFGQAHAAVAKLHDWDTFFAGPGHASHHDAVRPGFTVMTGRPYIMQMDGQCAAATAVLELLAHETNGKVEFFKGCPEEWKDVSFENLALSDGRRVSGRRVDGKVFVKEK